MTTIEGFTPGMLWDTVIVLIGLATIVVLVDKVMEIFRQAKKRQRERDQQGAEPVSSIEARVTAAEEEIKQLRRDVDQMQTQQDDVRDGFANLGVAVLAILNHDLHNGNTDEMLQAQSKLNDYLLRRQ